MNKDLVNSVSDSDFLKIVSNSESIREVAKKLGFKHEPGKNSKFKIKDRMSKLNLKLKKKEKRVTKTVKFVDENLNTKDIGNIGSGSLIFKCARLGLVLSEPIGDNSPYDFILDKNKRLLKVQVKTITKFENDSSVFTLTMTYKTSSKNTKNNYTTDDVDLFYLYNAAIDEGYLVKSKDICNDLGKVQESITFRHEDGILYKNSKVSKDYLFENIIGDI
jgi:hypothetical protein